MPGLQTRVKLTNEKLNKFKSAANNKTGLTIRISKKNVQDEDYHMNYFGQQNWIRNDFSNHFSTDIEHSKAHLSKIIQRGSCFGNMMTHLGKKHINRS